MQCVCGFEPTSIGSFGSHAKNCKAYKEEKARLENIDHSEIVKMYMNNYSVTECCKNLQERYALGMPTIRNIITPILKEANVYEGVGGKNTQAKKQEKIKKTMLKKYGVINAGQLDGNGFKEQNKIPYEQPEFFKKYKEYRKEVERKTAKNIAKIKKPKFCEYTGIKFADEIFDKVNPNDPRKRTVDHKVSIYECFCNGWTVDQAAGIDNLIFCLRICNTIKGNDNFEHFTDKIVKHLKRELINEGYEYKEN